MRPQPDFIHEFVPGSSPRTLLLLHGTGGNERDLITLGRELDPSAALVSPRGKVLENGMPRFFRRLAEGVFDLEDLKHRANELADFVAAPLNITDSPAITSWQSVIPTAQTLPPACCCFGPGYYAPLFFSAPWFRWCRKTCRTFRLCASGSERERTIGLSRRLRPTPSLIFCAAPVQTSRSAISKLVTS